MKFIIGLIIATLIIGSLGCIGQKPSESVNTLIESKEPFIDKVHQEVFEALKLNDSLLFDLGFNQCDTNQLRILVSSDFEFYHDQAGITDSKESFIQSIAGLCNMNYRPTRELDVESLEVHLLKANGKVYGAIQKGKHRFYGEEENRPKYLTSTADFTHLWIIEEGNWKIKRVLSYNHKEPDNE